MKVDAEEAVLSFSCPVCARGAFDRSRPYAHRASAESALFKGRRLVRCKSCRTFSVFPMPPDDGLAAYYDLYWKSGGTLETRSGLFEAQAVARAAYLRPHIPRGGRPLKILDVGAGFGFLKTAMAETMGRPVEYDALERDTSALRHLGEVIRPNRVYAHVEEITGRYSAVVLSHILEHMPRPLDFLTSHRALLEDDGLLFIEVPNQDNLYKPRNEPHLVFFSPESLKALVRGAGCRVLSADTCGEKINDIVRQKWPETVTREARALWMRGLRLLSHYAGRPIDPAWYGVLGKAAAAPLELPPGATPDQIKAIRKNNRRLLNAEIERQTASVSMYGPGRRWIRLVAEAGA